MLWPNVQGSLWWHFSATTNKGSYCQNLTIWGQRSTYVLRKFFGNRKLGMTPFDNGDSNSTFFQRIVNGRRKKTTTK